MNRALLARLLGKILLLGSVTMLPSLIMALADGTKDAMAFLVTILIMAALGGLTFLIRARSDIWRARAALGGVTLCWLMLSLFGALPFCLSGYASLVDAFFETVSGFTTTGATILTDIESLPRSLLFWRSFTHWIGGMGVLVLSLAIMPKMGERSMHLLRAEAAGPEASKLVPRIGQSVRLLYVMYVLLSLLMTMCLMLCGLNLYDALIRTFGTAGTGGFSNYAASVGHFNSPAVEIVISVFMLLFGTNFTIFFLIITRNWKAIRQNTELRLYGAMVFGSILGVTLSIRPLYANIWDALRVGLFQVSSIISSTGFCTADFNLWPMFAKAILLLLMLTGCCAGSTGGGIKLIRVAVLFKNIRREIRRTARPREVGIIRIDGRAADEQMVSSVTVFMTAYVMVLVLSVLLLSLDGLDFETTFTSALTCMGNIGPGLGQTGPVGNFAVFSPFSKIILSIDMLIGRLDVFPILMLFTRKAWSR